jgi:beta-lactamase regulating signal transducer with metallopeptidase domain
MTGVWLAYALLVGLLLAGMARCLSEACRLAARPTRWVWIAALGLMAALVALAPYRMAPPATTITRTVTIPVSVLPANAAWAQAEPSSPSWLDRARAIGPAVAAPMQAAITAVGARVPQGLMHHFTTLWLALSALLLALCAATYARFYRLRHGWPVADIDGVRVRIAPDGGPAVVGWSQPEIIVPSWLFRHTPEERRLVLAHEREHVNARDPLLIAIGCAIAVLLPWHPVVWWMFARLRLAVELDCDLRVLRRGVAPRRYGAVLIDLAGRCPGMPVGAPALADKSSHLRQRLLAMRAPRLSFARTRGVALGALAVIVLIAACVVQIPNIVAQDERPASEIAATPEAEAPVISMLESAAAPAPHPDNATSNHVVRRRKRATSPAHPTTADSATMMNLGTAFLNATSYMVSVGNPTVKFKSRAVTLAMSESLIPDTVTTRITADLATTGQIHWGTALNVVLSNVVSSVTGHFQVQLDQADDSASHQGGNIELPMLMTGMHPIAFDLVGKLESAKSAFATVVTDSVNGLVVYTTAPGTATNQKP